MTTPLIQTGNARVDVAPYRGWLVGHFVDERDGALRRSEEVEIAWRVHSAGEARAEWVRREKRTTIVVLVSGRLRIQFAEEEGGREEQVVLAHEGDYVMWGCGVDHRWYVEEDCVFV
jgi:hypothetical protein